MRRLLLLLAPLVLGGCLDYEIVIETVVHGDGSAHRVVRIRERSKDHKTWAQFAPPKAPYKLAGNDAEGFRATATFKPGVFDSGIRVLRDAFEGDYLGADSAKNRASIDGRGEVTADDLMIGTLYSYRETFDVGIDAAAFRRAVPFLVETGLETLVCALELLEPETNFDSVRLTARAKLAPDLSRSVIAIHTELAALVRAAGGPPWVRPLAQILKDRRMLALLAELDRLGVRRREGAPKATELQEFFDPKHWTLRESLWTRLLEPLPGDHKALADRLWKRLNDGSDDDQAQIHKKGEESQPGVFDRAYERAFEPGVRAKITHDTRRAAIHGLGALMVSGMLDSHRATVTVRLPGSLLRTNGTITDAQSVRWRCNPKEVLANSEFWAWSFEPSKTMVGRIVDFPKLLLYRHLLKQASKAERESIGIYLGWARKVGFEAARNKISAQQMPALKALKEAIG